MAMIPGMDQSRDVKVYLRIFYQSNTTTTIHQCKLGQQTKTRKPPSMNDKDFTNQYDPQSVFIRRFNHVLGKAFFPDELHSILDPKAVRKLQTIKRRVDLSKYGDNEEEKDDDEEVDPETGESKKVAEGEEELEEEVEDDDDDDDNDYGDDYFDNGENDLDEDRDEDANDY
ncbi:hypothetical protein B0O80DRAFT_426119 [Mortierella sp. GBAus27b]|nr:hypothetical protein B0O80DRAFT_426119 [Mortierella sp. GBAus27b]